MKLTIFNASDTGLEITVTEQYDETTRERSALSLPPHKTDIITISSDSDYSYTLGINTVT